MQARPLAQQFGDGPRVGKLVGRGPRPVVGRHVADAVARCLDGMHLDFGQRRQDVGSVLKLDPVELHVLPGGEMAVARSQRSAMSASRRIWRDDRVP